MAPLLMLITAAGSAMSHVHVVKVRVRFLATSTSVHSGVGESQDVYLVELPADTFGENPILARLVDDYSPAQTAFSPKALSGDGLILRIRRDESCDTTLADMPLRTAPGDPLAILPERFGFHVVLPRETSTDEILPCYKTFRH
ncbi:MAG TPA: hypothetical protein VHX37_06795 [Acidobacteriaceae bacterium]|nr:hypothetical protein [Acidobacteriaceae bacterium]